MNHEYKIVLILPYFGQFNNYFPLYLESCRSNPTIDWIIFTDDKHVFNYPPNVRVIYISFEEFRELIQLKFDFNISLRNPYRLCNFKPAYGDIFKDYIINYDFWGYCDNDLIWGDLRNFLSEDVLANYNKIFELGHISLIRNAPKYNELYKYKNAYKLAFSEDYDLLFFDEHGLNDIFRITGEKIYKHTAIADFNPRRYNFKLNSGCTVNENFNSKHIYSWENGKLLRHYVVANEVETEEVMYIHFLKRNMTISKNLRLKEAYVIKPNEFLNLKQFDLSCDNISKCSTYRFYKDYWFKKLTLSSLMIKFHYRVCVNPKRKKVLSRIKSILLD